MAEAKRRWSLWLLGLALVLPLVKLDGEVFYRRLAYHFYYNNYFDPAREVYVIPQLPFTLTREDTSDLLKMVDEDGKIRSKTASDASNLPAYFPESIRNSTVNGIVAYASQIRRDNPEGAAAMFKVRDRVVKRLVDSKVLPHTVYGVNETVPWGAFSVTSYPSDKGTFGWHYDAESANEYRALFVVSGGDDCGVPAVHYRNKDGQVRDLAVKTGHGYLIRGSATFHAVHGGGCPTADGKPRMRHLVGFQLSQLPHRRPMPVCFLLLELASWLSATLWGN